MAKDPAFLFYPSDFMTGTKFFSYEQKGKYIELLCLQHQHGHLSEEDMLHICGSYDERIFKKFAKDEHGLYFNEVLEGIIFKRKAYSESRAKNRKGAPDKESKPVKKPKKISKSYVPHMENVIENINRDIIIKEEPKKEPEFEIIMPPGFTDDFSRAWAAWKNYRLKTHKFKYKTEESEQAAISQLVKKGSGREANCLEIIEHSISRQWEGLILTEELKKQFDVTGPNQNKSGNRPATGGNVSTARAFSAIDAFYDSIGER